MDIIITTDKKYLVIYYSQGHQKKLFLAQLDGQTQVILTNSLSCFSLFYQILNFYV